MGALGPESQSADHPDFLRDLYGPEGSFNRHVITGEPMADRVGRGVRHEVAGEVPDVVQIIEADP